MLESWVLFLVAHLRIYKWQLQLLIAAIAPIFLYKCKSDNNLRSDESLYGTLNPYENLANDRPEEFIQMPPHQTICIVMNGHFPGLVERVKHIRLRSKFILFTTKDIDQIFFVKLKIRAADHSCVVLDPLQRILPDSDLVFLAGRVFGSKTAFQPRSLFYNNYNNTIHLDFCNDHKNHNKLLILLRYYMNVEAFTWSNYFYIPFPNYHIRAEPIVGFIIAVFGMCILNCEAHGAPLPLLCRASLFIAAPISVIFMYDRGANGLLIFLFSIINFKFGFLFSILCYISITLANMKKLGRNVYNRILTRSTTSKVKYPQSKNSPAALERDFPQNN